MSRPVSLFNPYSDAELVERAVRAAAHRAEVAQTSPWVEVKRTFGTGQTVSRELCRRFEIDPDVE